MRQRALLISPRLVAASIFLVCLYSTHSLCCSLSDLAASLATADAALRIMIVAAVQTGLQAIGLQVCFFATIAAVPRPRAHTRPSQSLNWLDHH